jgi:hypothetical protein
VNQGYPATKDWEKFDGPVFSVDDFVDTSGRSHDVSLDGQKLYVVRRAEPLIRDRIIVISHRF